eukprot:6959-Heterococcus_DN1.PRE.1
MPTASCGIQLTSWQQACAQCDSVVITCCGQLTAPSTRAAAWPFSDDLTLLIILLTVAVAIHSSSSSSRTEKSVRDVNECVQLQVRSRVVRQSRLNATH